MKRIGRDQRPHWAARGERIEDIIGNITRRARNQQALTHIHGECRG
jgi:hypothetical protein